MQHTITVSEELYAYLATVAAEHGQSVEDVISESVQQRFPKNIQPIQTPSPPEDEEQYHVDFIEGYDPKLDPLAPFLGAFHFGKDRSWIDRHDAIFGGAEDDGE